MRCVRSTYAQHKINAGLEFWQTGSNGIITYQSVPKECVVKVVSESGKREMFARQLTSREGPKVTLREKWVHRSSNALRLTRETEKKLQKWDSNPIPSESHMAEGGVLNTLFIFESTASLPTKQEIENCMKFRKGLTKYSFNDVIHSWTLDSKYVIAEEN